MSCTFLEDVLLSLLKPTWHKHSSTEQGMFSASRTPSRGRIKPELLAGRGCRDVWLQDTVPTSQLPNSPASSFPLNKLQLHTQNNITLCSNCKHTPHTLINPLFLPLFTDTALSRVNWQSEMEMLQSQVWQTSTFFPELFLLTAPFALEIYEL